MNEIHSLRLHPVVKLPFFSAALLFFASWGTSRKLSVASVTATDAVWNATNIAAFEKTLEDLRNRHRIPALSVGIVNGKTLAWEKGFGYADLETKTIPDEHTVYHLASITKTFGAIILLQLVEEGKLNLEDPIAKYGINLGARWGSDEGINVKHLLTHSQWEQLEWVQTRIQFPV